MVQGNQFPARTMTTQSSKCAGGTPHPPSVYTPEAPPGSVSPGVPLGRGWQETVFKRPCPPLRDWREATSSPAKRGSRWLQEAARWHRPIMTGAGGRVVTPGLRQGNAPKRNWWGLVRADSRSKPQAETVEEHHPARPVPQMANYVWCYPGKNRG